MRGVHARSARNVQGTRKAHAKEAGPPLAGGGPALTFFDRAYWSANLAEIIRTRIAPSTMKAPTAYRPILTLPVASLSQPTM